jgi:predicted AlkP superfamily pyrophosphatase or phosphodiesterase
MSFIKRVTLFALFSTVCLNTNAQKTSTSSKELSRPKLVVGIVVDQMRWDYLYRFYNRYGETGFKRLLNQGFSCENTLINYIPTLTAIGHSSIFTGSVPSIHGIAGNDWIDRATGKLVYCAEDSTVSTVGAPGKEGKMSPRNLLASTITDELAIATNFQSRIIGVSLKDRAAILPAGHTPTGAFWMDDASGNFITSTYYMNQLPDWVEKFNKERNVDKLIAKPWNTLYPINTYKQSAPDDSEWEGKLKGEEKPVFPHDIAKSYKLAPVTLRQTPFGNTLTLDFAKRALNAYNLGNGVATDFLTINCAATDYVGHLMGPNSIEIEDVYLRLDKDLGSFFEELDKKVGKGNYTVFLTADHGAANAIKFNQAHNIPSDAINAKNLQAGLNKFLKDKFGVSDNLIKSYRHYQFLFNQELIAKNKLKFADVKFESTIYLREQPGVQFAIDLENAASATIPNLIKERIINGFNYKRHGDVQIINNPGWFSGGATGTSHGTYSAYDAHIPLIFMGWGINQGSTNRETYITDIAPTIAAFLHVQMPNGAIGKPITEVLKK